MTGGIGGIEGMWVVKYEKMRKAKSKAKKQKQSRITGSKSDRSSIVTSNRVWPEVRHARYIFHLAPA